MLRFLLALCALAVCWAQDCQVANIKVKENFDKTKYAGRWYAVAKKDPLGIFLRDNVVAQFTILPSGAMTANAEGRVYILNNWEMCAHMFATFDETDNPAKFKMTYWGASAQLQTGYDDHWVIDTDYENYAVHYSCRVVDNDGTCLDGYSFIFSRHPEGLRPQDQAIVSQRKSEICFMGKYRRVVHTGFCQLEDQNGPPPGL